MRNYSIIFRGKPNSKDWLLFKNFNAYFKTCYHGSIENIYAMGLTEDSYKANKKYLHAS